MLQTRRTFLGAMAGAGSAFGLSPILRATPAIQDVKPAVKPLRVLILGGTGFIGPHQVQYALSRGHTVTIFNRGKTNPHLFPEVEKLVGDRNDNLEALKGREWDVVIDNSATIPRWVRQSAGLLKDAAERYLFVSTISVYADYSIVDMDESGPLAVMDDPNDETLGGATYGAMKALCEKEAAQAFPGRATIIRPGLIVGPGDKTDRFTYWPVRIDRGGEVLAPGRPTDPVQFIDARDITAWMVRMLEDGHAGTYNATGPKAPLTIAELLYGIRAITSSEVSFTWADADFLSEHKVRPWSDMPVWVPSGSGSEGFARINCRRAYEKGLIFRPLADTARDTLDWFKSQSAARRADMQAGLSAQREAEVLAALS